MGLPIEQGHNGISPAHHVRPFHCTFRSSASKLAPRVNSWRLTLFSSFHAGQRSAVASAGNGSWVNGSSQQ